MRGRQDLNSAAMSESAAAMRIGVFQGPAAGGSKRHMLDAMAAVASNVSAQGARLLVMPELFLTGYNIGAAALADQAEPRGTGASFRAASDIAKAHGIALLYGYPERGADGALYNSASMIGPDGSRLTNYRKIHLFGDMEKAAFTPGREPCVTAEIDGVRVGAC